MDLLQLQYFRTAAREGNFTRAADKLLVSQPALSKIIKNLEDELGAKLFDRRGRNIYLNEIGKIMLFYADRILSAVEDAKKEISDKKQSLKGHCTFSMTAATRLLPEIVVRFKELYPQTDIICTQESHSSPQPTNDLYIYSSRQEEENAVTLLREECVLCVPENHFLAGRSSLTAEEKAMLRDENFLVIQNKMPTYQLTEELCREGGFKPHIALECDSSETIFSLIEAHMGVAVLPFVTWRKSIISRRAGIVRIGEDFCRYILLREREGRYATKAAENFRDFVIAYFKQIERNESLLKR